MRVRIHRGIWVLGVVGVLFGGLAWLRWRPSAGELLANMGLWCTVAAAALLHEAGHLLTARLLGVRVSKAGLDLFGARLELEGMISYPREWWVAAGGPLVNLLSAAAVYPVAARGTEWAAWFFGASITLAAVNLLPVETLDGGRMLTSAVAGLFGDAPARWAVHVSTAICMGLLWMLSVYALLRAEQMLSVFAFALCLLLRSIGGSYGNNSRKKSCRKI